MKLAGKIFKIVIFLAIIVSATLYFSKDLNLAIENFSKIISPCDKPIAYSIGDLDKRFGLSEDDLIKAVNQAAQIWEEGAGRKLFSYSEAGSLKINLIYDSRQDSTVKLNNLGINISKDKATYEALKNKYDVYYKNYNTQKKELDDLVNYYNQQKANYEDEVKAANRRGGATPDEIAILEQERKDLNVLAASIQAKQGEFNKTVDDLNALANVINRLIYELNLNVSNYNTIGSSAAGEFQEGEYISDAAGVRINIYQFDSRELLLRVLAHELGHALGLEHVDNPQAIMYRLNESGNDKLTADDLKELKAVCKIK
ncbi:MAG: matrixin family metalloprotease [Patescibacteria group bacterium]|nr:matrixin family metalloprotease [Patescibacteria group bacterium]